MKDRVMKQSRFSEYKIKHAKGPMTVKLECMMSAGVY